MSGLEGYVPTLDELDERWIHALDGLRVALFSSQRVGRETGVWKVYGEITGIDGFYVYVVVDGEGEPRRVFWTNVRPLAPSEKHAREREPVGAAVYE